MLYIVTLIFKQPCYVVPKISFDKFSVLLETGSQEQLIFKHAISTISQTRKSGDLHPAQAAETHARHDEVNSPQA